jgi:perosamine synthetase
LTDRFLNYGRQKIDADDIDAVVQVLNGDFLTQGPTVERFELALAEKVGAKYAVAVSSGTAALHIACMAAGMSPNDIGITSTLTFVASANAFLYCGGSVQLTDIDADTLNMSPELLRAHIESDPSIKAVIPVHFGGLVAGSVEIRKAVGNRIVIEDASHSLGGYYEDGKPVGSCAHSDMTIFSFHPVKPITTGEGGAVTTNDEKLYRKLKAFSNHGIERSEENFSNQALAFENGKKNKWYYEQQELGFNYRLSDIHAVLGLSQLNKLDVFIDRRRKIALTYDEAFSDIRFIHRPQSRPEYRERSAHHLYIVEIDFQELGISRGQFLDQLLAFNVGAQVHYIPVHRQPYHQNHGQFQASDFPVAESYFSKCLSLPLHAGMDDSEIDRVINAIKAVTNNQKDTPR